MFLYIECASLFELAEKSLVAFADFCLAETPRFFYVCKFIMNYSSFFRVRSEKGEN